MPSINHKKIFDAAASALSASANVIIEALDLNRYSASVTLENGKIIIITAVTGEYQIELSIPVEALDNREYTKFLSRFEYTLEQKFLKNIRFEQHITTGEYRLKISL